MVEVKDISKVDDFNDEMKQLGFEPKGENGIAHRRFFSKGGNNRTHHVHVFEKGSEHIIRHLAFRDYLIAHPNEAKAYSDLKIELAKNFSFNIEAYIVSKDSLVKQIEQKALKWVKMK